jgi:hypothetical protein
VASNNMPPEYRAYQKKLERLAAGTFPRVIADTVNTVAGFAHIQSIRNVRERMVLRNAYTERSIRYYKANPKADATKINAVTGSVQPYMALQEKGGYRRPKRGRKAPVATLAARGGSSTRVVLRKFMAGTLFKDMFVGVPRGIMGKGPYAGGKRPLGVYLRHNKNKRLTMLRNLASDRVPIKATKWHTDAIAKYSSRSFMTAEFLRQARYLLKK